MEEASVAGESPDRSKQHESSVEPTSGSEGTVPEARDPRLAVSREKDSSGGTTDTATKVLSVRDVKRAASGPEDEDADLREAVSAWVRSADKPERPEDADDTGNSTPEGATQEAPETVEPAAQAPKPDASPAAAPDAATEAKATTEAAPDTDSDAETATDPEPATKAETATDGKADTEADPKTDARPAATADAVADADAKPGSEAAAKADAEADPKTDARPAAAADAVADAKPGAKAAAAGTGAAGKADADPAAKAGTEVKTDTDARTGTDAKVANADTDAAAGAGDAEGGNARPAAEADADEKADADADAKAGTGSAAKTGAAGKAAADDPQAADGEGAPQGPPAPDDETRTGGAGGSTPDEGEAEADTPAKADPEPVDQPTTVFKAVRPKKPEVDQPTTMLKLGGAKPRQPEPPEADRTSKFVALKPDVTAQVPQLGPERTTQQPLPPKPPLDLLAELTNTPPPPETPVRTLVRRVKIWTPVVLLLAVVVAVVQSVRPLPQPTLDLTAKDTYTFPGAKPGIPWPASGEAALEVQGIGSFGSSGAQKPVPIASVAKVMTAYLILRDHPLKSGEAGPKIKIDKAAEQQSDAGQESTVKVTAGDSISEREALEAILLPSANNVARLLARWDVGSEKAFVTKMNAAAKSLGMVNTRYTDPSGLTDSTVSTAVDQVKLARAAMAKPAFREVAAMMSYDDYKGVNHSNYNRLVGHDNVVGIKTGTTTSALGNLVFAAKQQVGGETRTVIGAVLRQPAGGFDNTIISGVLDAGKKLMQAAQGALKPATILKKGDVVGYVDDGLGGRTPVVATKDVTAAGWSGLKVKLSFTADAVPHTAKAGTKVGSLTVGDGSAAGAVQVPVALEKDLTEPGFAAKLTRLG
ncbi:D-alanyl-D-alanine carboxypeptidase [Streptomyces bungoensis]|uniref:D-alanyl-D-alanine carboxypeptidase n=1 Tax=Streptomyces bungoensis TaxID=285568 RepID=UPI00099E8214